MKEHRFGEGKFAQFIAGKGFYVALAVCLVGAAAAAWLTIDKTLESLTGQGEVPISEVSESAARPAPESAAAAAPGETESETFWPFTQKTTYALPVQGDIIQDYSDGELVKNETLGEWRTHDGIDIKCEAGADICAPADGKITRVWSDPMWGECVEMEHADGVTSVFCGLDKELSVKEGDEVKLGGVIGKLGETNSAEIGADSHLHFAMKKDGKYADPLQVMGME